MTGFELGSFGKGGDRAVNCDCLTISSNVKLEHFYGLEITQFQRKVTYVNIVVENVSHC